MAPSHPIDHAAIDHNFRSAPPVPGGSSMRGVADPPFGRKAGEEPAAGLGGCYRAFHQATARFRRQHPRRHTRIASCGAHGTSTPPVGRDRPGDGPDAATQAPRIESCALRILFCNYEYPPLGGGGGVVMAALARALARRHEVMVLTSRAGALPAYSEDAGVRVLRVP